MSSATFATTQNNYIGDGVTTLYPFTFQYIDKVDVRIQLDGTDTTEYTLANATTVSLNTPPAPGVQIRVYRSTDTTAMPATFFAGSTIQARDLNDNFNVALFVSQEAQEGAADAADALPIATAAKAAADAAVADVAGATQSAQTANDAALAATQDANAATQAANDAAQAAADAETVADQAVATANAAAALVAQASLPTIVPNVASIPSSPSTNDLVEVTNSTGIENFGLVSGIPLNFQGDAGVAVKILWTGSTWSFVEYRPTDPDARYATEADANQIVTDGLDAFQPQVDAATAEAQAATAAADSKMPINGGTFTGLVSFAPGQDFNVSTATSSSAGSVRLSNSVSSNSGTGSGIAATPSAVKTTYDRSTIALNAASNAEAGASNANAAALDALNAAAGALQRTGGSMSGVITFASGQTFNIGTGNETTKGILQLSNRVDLTSGMSGGIAATPSAVRSAYNLAQDALEAASSPTSGTWSPAVDRLDDDNQDGFWYRIGNLVFVTFKYSWDGKNSSGDPFEIKNLPFTVNKDYSGVAISNLRGFPPITDDTNSFFKDLLWGFKAGTKIITLRVRDYGESGSDELQTNTCDDEGYVQGSGCYIATPPAV